MHMIEPLERRRVNCPAGSSAHAYSSIVISFPEIALSQLAFDDLVTHLQQMGDQLASQAPLHKISTLQDVEQGKRLEVEETLGHAVRHGAALGIPTPTMDVCYKLIAGINHYLQ